MKIERRRTRARSVGLLMERDALEEDEFHQTDVLFEAELGLMVAALADSALARDIRGMLDVIVAIDPGSDPESVPRLSGYPDLVRAAPPLKAGAPVSRPGDSAARRRTEAFENGFEIEPRLRSERGRAQSNSSVARGYA
jgi:LDH2 family malate/lactate/ureidoglycolate dehydrogenase